MIVAKAYAAARAAGWWVIETAGVAYPDLVRSAPAPAEGDVGTDRVRNDHQSALVLRIFDQLDALGLASPEGWGSDPHWFVFFRESGVEMFRLLLAMSDQFSAEDVATWPLRMIPVRERDEAEIEVGAIENRADAGYHTSLGIPSERLEDVAVALATYLPVARRLREDRNWEIGTLS